MRQIDAPSTGREDVGDNISRQAVLEWLKTEWDGMVTSVFDGVEQLPSTDRTGEWEHDVDGHFFCTNCKKYPEYQVRMSDYCPNCGADMRGEQDAD